MTEQVEQFKGFTIVNGVQPNFIIKRRGKPVVSVCGTYEDARCMARQLIRKAVKAKRTVRKGLWDDVSRNPTSLTEYGYKIVRVFNG